MIGAIALVPPTALAQVAQDLPHPAAPDVGVTGRLEKTARDEQKAVPNLVFEFWTTLGADIAFPLAGSVRSTLQRRYSQLHFYIEAARRANFAGLAQHRARARRDRAGGYAGLRLTQTLTTCSRCQTRGRAC